MASMENVEKLLRIEDVYKLYIEMFTSISDPLHNYLKEPFEPDPLSGPEGSIQLKKDVDNAMKKVFHQFMSTVAQKLMIEFTDEEIEKITDYYASGLWKKFSQFSPQVAIDLSFAIKTNLTEALASAMKPHQKPQKKSTD